MKPLYLDYHATTPVDPRVLDEMLPFFTERFGNPHSKQHAWGWEARDAVEKARAQVAALATCSLEEISSEVVLDPDVVPVSLTRGLR